MSNEEINLLKRDFSSVGVTAEMENKMRAVAWWSLIALFVVGIILTSVYFLLSSRVNQLQGDIKNVSIQINAESVKEGILLSLKERSDVAKKALDAARPWGNLFPLLTRMAQSTQLHSLTIDESGKVSLLLMLPSIDDAVSVVTNIILMTQEKVLRSPQIISLIVQQDSMVQLNVSFTPVL
jgi:hypothetical protein